MDILHVDASLVVLNKPAGLAVVPDGWEKDTECLVKLAETEYGRLWVVHRLDKVTSGALVMARTTEAHRALSMQFEQHQAQKVYHAIANGVPDWDERTVRRPLRSNVGHKHRTVVDPRHGKASRTTFRVLERHRAHVLLEALPWTGRTHQIRAHAAVLGYPLLADALYGAPPTELSGRPALHSVSLSFRHPETQDQVTFTAPYPRDFEDALLSLRAKRP